MCLDSLISKSEYSVSGIGYKRIYTGPNGLWHSIYNEPQPFDEWLEATRTEISLTNGGRYPAGFHFYPRRESCFMGREFAIVATIEYDRLLCAGLECGEIVLVAREMRVLRASLSSMEGRITKRTAFPIPTGIVPGIWYYYSPTLERGRPINGEVTRDVNTREVMF